MLMFVIMIHLTITMSSKINTIASNSTADNRVRNRRLFMVESSSD